MVFNLIVLLVILGIAYFHWVQGFLSGIISMVLAIAAASLAMGYHESVATGVMGGKFADSANAMMLCVIFAIVYGVGRVVFDSLIPGNVRLPLYLDAVGGGACGLVVGIFAVGTLAIAMQSMPFGPAILMHSRYALADDKEVTVNGSRRQEVAKISGALEDDRPDSSKEIGFWINADSMVADFAAFQSESGALAGATKFRDRHPEFLKELFLQRLGMESGAKHTALNIKGRSDVELKAVFAPPTALPQMDGENPLLARGRKLAKSIAPDPAKITLVLRVEIARNATDTDSRFRFSPGSIRLLTNGKDLMPDGVLYEPGRTNMVMNYRADDYMVAMLDKTTGVATIDLVFIASRADVLADAAAKEGLKLKPGAFLEVKRYSRIDLSDHEVVARLPSDPESTGMLFKKDALVAAAAGGELPKSK